jgi:hypothetical protein
VASSAKPGGTSLGPRNRTLFDPGNQEFCEARTYGPSPSRFFPRCRAVGGTPAGIAPRCSPHETPRTWIGGGLGAWRSTRARSGPVRTTCRTPWLSEVPNPGASPSGCAFGLRRWRTARIATALQVDEVGVGDGKDRAINVALRRPSVPWSVGRGCPAGPGSSATETARREQGTITTSRNPCNRMVSGPLVRLATTHGRYRRGGRDAS